MLMLLSYILLLSLHLDVYFNSYPISSISLCQFTLYIYILFSGQNQKGFLSAKLEELLKLMIEVLPSLHFSAKRHRLDCLYELITHASKVITN